MTIVEFFNPRRIGHLVAYDEFVKTGHWPKDFSKDCEFPGGWQWHLASKIANEYVAQSLRAGGMKQKLHQAKIRLMGNDNKTAEAQIAVAVMGEVGLLMIE